MYLAWCAEQRLNTTALDSADLWVAELESASKHSARHGARSLKAHGKYLAEDLQQADPFARLVLPVEPEPLNARTATDDELERLLAVCTSTIDD